MKLFKNSFIYTKNNSLRFSKYFQVIIVLRTFTQDFLSNLKLMFGDILYIYLDSQDFQKQTSNKKDFSSNPATRTM